MNSRASAGPTSNAEAERISKSFGSTRALDNVSVDVRAGECHALVGRNGAGKSTLVSILTGLTRPDQGEVRLQGQPVPPLGDRAAWQERVACVYQHSKVVPMLTVAENLFLNRFDGQLISWRRLRAAAWLIVPKSSVGLGSDLPVALGIVVLLAVGFGIGLFNGVMIVKGRFNSFIFTLAMLILLAGIQQGIVSGNTIYAMPPSFVYLGSAAWLGVPVSAWVSGLIFLGCGLFLRYHRTGRAIYAIGGNVEAARAAGIRVDRIRIGVFAVAGLLASVAGLMTAGHVDAVTANQGNNLIFTVFAAAVIGGISLDGGRGRILGAFTGVVLLGLVQNILVLSQVSTFWISAADGAIILAALILARFVEGGRK